MKFTRKGFGQLRRADDTFVSQQYISQYHADGYNPVIHVFEV